MLPWRYPTLINLRGPGICCIVLHRIPSHLKTIYSHLLNQHGAHRRHKSRAPPSSLYIPHHSYRSSSEYRGDGVVAEASTGRMVASTQTNSYSILLCLHPVGADLFCCLHKPGLHQEARQEPAEFPLTSSRFQCDLFLHSCHDSLLGSGNPEVQRGRLWTPYWLPHGSYDRKHVSLSTRRAT